MDFFNSPNPKMDATTYLKVIKPDEHHGTGDSPVRCLVSMYPCQGATWGEKAESGGLIVHLHGVPEPGIASAVVEMHDEAYLVDNSGNTIQRVGFVYRD